MIPHQPYRELSLLWQGQLIALRYTPVWLEMPGYGVAHLELRTGGGLPVAETGYRSVFLPNPPDDFDPVAFVRDALDEAAAKSEWQARETGLRQGSLF